MQNMTRRILLPLDLARDCQQQIRYGIEVASTMRAELFLLHVTRPDRCGRRPEWPAKWESRTGDQAVPAPMTVLSGNPAEKIAQYANTIDADFILMPTRGRGFLGQILFGSATTDLLRIVNRPLWIAKPASVAAAEPVRAKRILCCVEFGSQGEAVLRYAADLAAVSDGEVLVVHAVPEISEATMMTILDDCGEVELRADRAEERLAAMTATIDVPYQVEVKTGDVAAIMRRLAKRWRADVVVAGRGRRTNLRQLGPNISDIIVRAPCPVIAYPGRRRRLGVRGSETYGLASSRTEAMAALEVCR